MFGLGKKKKAVLQSPFPGTLVPIDQVADPVFSQKMLGDGFAVEPPQDAGTIDVLAPCNGRIATLVGSGHAVAIVSDQDLEVLIHVGLETVELKGEGFETLVSAGDEVATGDPLLRVDVATVRSRGCSAVTPVVCTNAAQVAEISVEEGPAGPVAHVTLA